MSIVYELIVAVHLIGMAAIVGAFLVVLRRPRYVPAFLYGAVTQLVTGLALVGIRESKVLADEEPLNHAAVGVKLLIALIVAGIAWVQRGKTNDAPTGMIHAIGGLAIINVLVAVLWL
jgi:hypothetical protein